LRFAVTRSFLLPVLTSALGVEMDQVDDEQLGEEEIAQMREQMEKLNQELQVVAILRFLEFKLLF